jgi:hypothetical protein
MFNTIVKINSTTLGIDTAPSNAQVVVQAMWQAKLLKWKSVDLDHSGGQFKQ